MGYNSGFCWCSAVLVTKLDAHFASFCLVARYLR